MKSGGRFVQDVEAAPGSRGLGASAPGGAVEVVGEFEALAFAAGQGGEGLPEGEVAESGAGEGGQAGVDAGFGEQVGGAGGVHGHDLGDRMAAQRVPVGLGAVAGAMAGGADGGDGFEERQVGGDRPGAVAGGAGAGGVVAEPAGVDVVGGGEQAAQRVQDAEVGGGAGPA